MRKAHNSKIKSQNSKIMKDSIIIVSGGMDSITLLYDWKDRIALGISFDYGSNHNAKEIPLAKMHCERLGIKHITIPLEFMHQYFKSSLLEGGDAIPEGHYASENMKSTVVPFRNGIMLAAACGLAESNGLKFVMIANHGGDHAIYPDCREGFINAMSEAMAALAQDLDVVAAAAAPGGLGDGHLQARQRDRGVGGLAAQQRGGGHRQR